MEFVTRLHNLYRKGGALKHALAETKALQGSLIAARGRLVPRLLQVANASASLLVTELDIVEARAEARLEIPNPFYSREGIAETKANIFTGRRDIVQKLEANVLSVERPPLLLLHGARRMGKTSILNQLPRLLGPDFAPAVVDCQEPAVKESLAQLLEYLSGAICAGLRRRRIALDPLNPAGLGQGPFAAFDKWLDRLERTMPDPMRTLLCLDEYERLQATLNDGWGTDLLDALRHIIQQRPRVVLLFSGSHTFEQLGPVWTDRFISARRVRVSFLTREEVIPLLTKPIPEFDMTYVPGALDAFLAATNGQPFLTQAVAFELVQLLNEQHRKEATLGDVEQAITRALESGGEYFANLWSDAGEDGQAILRVVATGYSPPDSRAAQRHLREQDVLDGAGKFAVPMVERWVREKALREDL